MRHKVRGRKFGRERDHRRLLLKNLVSSLVEHGRINTTQAKAKELRGVAERLITYGKKNTVHHRRLAYKVLQNHDLVKKVFDEMGFQKYVTRGNLERKISKNMVIGLLISDKEAGVFFQKPDGELDLSEMFTSTEPEFIEWCLDYFEEHWKNSSSFQESKLKE